MVKISLWVQCALLMEGLKAFIRTNPELEVVSECLESDPKTIIGKTTDVLIIYLNEYGRFWRRQVGKLQRQLRVPIILLTNPSSADFEDASLDNLRNIMRALNQRNPAIFYDEHYRCAIGRTVL